MELIAGKSVLRGELPMPGSKSHTIRAVAFASLAEGESTIVAPLDSADTQAAVRCYRALGAEIECGTDWVVKGFGGCPQAPEGRIDVANSGTTLRFAIGSAALLAEGKAEFTGDHQIQKRPQGPLLNSLNDLGAHCISKPGGGLPPVVVQGTLQGGETTIQAVTSQYLSALLANAPLAKNDTIINVAKLNEKPYVEITLRYLDEFGIKYDNIDDMKKFVVRGGQSYRAFEKRVPADFSSATFFLCAGAFLDAELVLEGLDFTDAQGDKAVVDILKAMGADLQQRDSKVYVKRGTLRGMDIDMNAIPDALPALAVTACFAEGQTRLLNVEQARLKETDRIAVMAAELTKMGADIHELPDGLIINGSKLHPAEVCGHDDHRVVMALSLAGMALDGQTKISTAEAMAVTFPNFVDLMKTAGAALSLAAEV